MMMLSTSIAAAPAKRCCFTSSKAPRAARPLQHAAVTAAARPERQADEQPASSAGNALAAVLLSASLLIAGPSTAAGLDTDTYKAGVKATIEASDIAKEKASDVVDKLKTQVLPDITAKLNKVAEGAGSNYPDSIVQELKTVASEIEALDEQVKGGADESVIKSAASGIEQQLNALKGILGFD
ncbi:hypothetical protein ABPG77_007778 [Micractinium sp. CCAP 211/92]